jgi:hypothetical protein
LRGSEIKKKDAIPGSFVGNHNLNYYFYQTLLSGVLISVIFRLKTLNRFKTDKNVNNLQKMLKTSIQNILKTCRALLAYYKQQDSVETRGFNKVSCDPTSHTDSKATIFFGVQKV